MSIAPWGAVLGMAAWFVAFDGAVDAAIPPICQDAQPLKRTDNRPAPSMCAVWTGSEVRFVIGRGLTGSADDIAAAAFPDSCDVEYEPHKGVAAKARWACNRETQRLLLPGGSRFPRVIPGLTELPLKKVKGLPAVEKFSYRPWAMWQSMRASLPEGTLPVPQDSLGPLPDGQLVTELPEILRREPVDYPDFAVASEFEGTVLVNALVDTTGRVVETRIARGLRQLDDAAVAAVTKYVFKPARFEGRAVRVWLVVPVRFELNDPRRTRR